MNKFLGLLSVRFYIAALGLLFVLCSAISLLGSHIARAASPYDNLLIPTSSLVIESSDGAYSMDITYSYVAIMQEKCPSLYGSYVSTRGDANGKLVIVQQNWLANHPRKVVRVAWTTEPNAGTQFNSPALNTYRITVPVQNTASIYMNTSGGIVCGSVAATQNFPIAYSSFSNPEFRLYLSTYPVNYPSYEGIRIEDGSAVDVDSDGLNLRHELQQGTLDNTDDSDGDGINDFTESAWNLDRDDIFCDKSVSPYVCAYPDPIKKDLYVEVDWMKNTSINRSFKPSSAQINLAKQGLDDAGYNVHVDTGQYGGGNELADYIQYLPFRYGASGVGFFDLKNGKPSDSIAANFSPDRQGIWRYLITGYGYDEEHSSSGATYPGSDNVFVSVGRIQDFQGGFGYTDVDTAIAGTIVHELGHSLCLSGTHMYSYQSVACRFSGIDTIASPNYHSVMNYDLQMFQNTLSNGSGGTGDHDDWGAISSGGVADFARWTVDELGFEAGVMHRGLSEKDAQNAIKRGTYGKFEKDGKIYDLRKNKAYDKSNGKVYDLDNRHQIIRGRQ